MIGTIIGDIVGSIYEFDNIRTKNFPLFGPGCAYTDDSIMALAVAEALTDTADFSDEAALRWAFVRSTKALAKRYPHPLGGYGARFGAWVLSEEAEPYNSWGNGSAMRVAPCGFAAASLEEALYLARVSAEITHNHPEAVAGAQTTAACVFLARTGHSREDIAAYARRSYGIPCPSVAELRKTYRFTERCRDTVPQAIQAFLESEGFEDAIRTAISIGGDSDTIGAITGGIAEAYYGVPGELRDAALRYLTPDLRGILDAFEAKFPK